MSKRNFRKRFLKEISCLSFYHMQLDIKENRWCYAEGNEQDEEQAEEWEFEDMNKIFLESILLVAPIAEKEYIKLYGALPVK